MSRLSDILNKFGFDEGEQIALLDDFLLAGFFDDEALQQAVNLINRNSVGEKITSWNVDEKEVFNSLKTVIDEAKNTENPARFLQQNLFSADFFDKQDIEDFFVYLGQTAFARKQNQERNELDPQAWMQDQEKAERFLRNAKILGMIDEINPSKRKYDESWIQGASRARTQKRIKYLKRLQDQGTNCGIVRLLTGEREMWAEIDKISDLEESKQFMLQLAEENGIAVNSEHPFTVRNIAGTNRTYLNYAEGETRKVTETMMAKKIYLEVFGREILESEVINAPPAEGSMRPTTSSAAADLVRSNFRNRIQTGFSDRNPGDQVRVLVVSDQPFCKRQELAVENAVRRELGNLAVKYELIFEGVGEGCNEELKTYQQDQAVRIIFSELGALIFESYSKMVFLEKMQAQKNAEAEQEEKFAEGEKEKEELEGKVSPLERKRSTDQLLYSKRCKAMPSQTISASSSSSLLLIESTTQPILT